MNLASFRMQRWTTCLPPCTKDSAGSLAQRRLCFADDDVCCTCRIVHSLDYYIIFQLSKGNHLRVWFIFRRFLFVLFYPFFWFLGSITTTQNSAQNCIYNRTQAQKMCALKWWNVYFCCAMNSRKSNNGGYELMGCARFSDRHTKSSWQNYTDAHTQTEMWDCTMHTPAFSKK